MTIGIDKRGFMWDEEDKVLSRKKELEEDSSVFSEEEKERMWVFYTNNTFGGKILTFSAAMTRNSVPMMEESGDFDATIDCWVEMFVKGFEACFMIGFLSQRLGGL